MVLHASLAALASGQIEVAPNGTLAMFNDNGCLRIYANAESYDEEDRAFTFSVMRACYGVEGGAGCYEEYGIDVRVLLVAIADDSHLAGLIRMVGLLRGLPPLAA